MKLGAHADPEGVTFRAYVTSTSRVAVRVHGRDVPLERREGPWFEKWVRGVAPGDRYEMVLDGEVVPDPYARHLPDGVHGPARVVAPSREPALGAPDAWSIYELHVGTFTPEGTYRAAARKLDDIADLGVSAIELMPVAAFPGGRGWGYDGVALFAPFAPYGAPEDLRAFVREAHARGLRVILDVVYNHFGPAGNYLARYAPEYFTSRIETPWGAAPDFTNPAMRSLAIDNARYWLEELGFDALRLDATHEIHDPSPKHVLREIADVAHGMTPRRAVFFEDDRNDPAVLLELGADGVWSDDFHHHLHVLLTGERDGYYAAYEPSLTALADCIRSGWSYTGQPYRPWDGRPRGARFEGTPEQLVVCIQNHDQVGNRAHGTRLGHVVDVRAFEAAAALLLFLPYTPLLFMGQEWAASSPFLFFSDHEGGLGKAVTEGRQKEFGSFTAFGGEVPDPQLEDTFLRSKLDWSERAREPHATVLETHRRMLRLRREDPILRATSDVDAAAGGDVLRVARGGGERVLYVHFGAGRARVDVPSAARVLFEARREAAEVLGPWGFVVLAV